MLTTCANPSAQLPLEVASCVQFPRQKGRCTVYTKCKEQWFLTRENGISLEVLHGYIFKKIFFNVFIYFWDRERQSMKGGGSEREGDTESEAGSRLRAVSPEPDSGLELTDREIMTWAEVGRSTDWATQVPLLFHFNHESAKAQRGWVTHSGALVSGSAPRSW